MAKQSFSVGQVLTAAQMTSLQQTAMNGGAASAKTASYTLVAADAGSAISMTSTSATTITVNTALFAAGDTVYITNLGAGVCTITAGTATVNSSASLALAQYESGFLDFTSTSAAIFVKGAGAGAASGGMTLISTTTLSGANPSLTSIPQTYKSLLLVFGNVTASSGNTYLQVGFNGSTTLFSGVYVLDNGVGQRIDDVVTFTRLYLKNTGGKNGGYLQLFEYASTTINKSLTYGGNSEASTNAITGGQGAGYLNTTSAITSIQLIFNDASALNGGTAYLYGVN
jgi:hypothetical protein